MAGDETALQQYGCSEISLCESLHIAHGESSAPAEAAIRALYNAHRGIEKDALLALVQEKRKAFIQTIAMRLKPLGFRKVRNNWTYTRDDGYQVLFVLQKSMYTDGYYFNVDIHPAGAAFPRICTDFRLLLEGEERLPWQALGASAMSAFLEEKLLPALHRLAFTPLDALGCDPLIWQECCCRRDLCERCWVEKNVWEAKGLPMP